jgi:drug/metabolite transporter (DMT)-like permease
VLYTALKNGLVALALAGAFVFFRKQEELRTLTRKQWLQLGAIGVVGGSVPFALYFTGLSMTTAMNAALIHKTLVLWVALFSYPFLRERLSPLAAAGITLVFGANIFLGGVGPISFGTGELFILLATLLWAAENIIAKKALAGISTLVVVSSRMILGSLLLFVFLSSMNRVAPAADLTASQWGWTALTALLLLGFVTTWYSALKRAPATLVAALLVPATLITNILSAIFLSKTMSMAQVTSMAVMVVGAALIFVVLRYRGGDILEKTKTT